MSFLRTFGFSCFSFPPVLLKPPLKFLEPDRLCFKVEHRMSSVYFHNETDDKYRARVIFKDPSDNINYSLTFERDLNESIGEFLKRLVIKLELQYSKKVSEATSIPRFNPILLSSNEPLQSTAAIKDLFNIKYDLKLKILENDIDVEINPPEVLQMALPDDIVVGSPVFPIIFKTLCVENTKCTFTWMKGKNKKWTTCGEGFVYTPNEDDIDCILKLICIPRNDFHKNPGLPLQILSKKPVIKSDNFDLISKRHAFTKHRLGEDEFRVVSYNILADHLTSTKEAKNFLFTYCNPEILAKNYRNTLLNFELSGYNADLLCMQEVQGKIFSKYLLPVFVSKGFHYLYLKMKNVGCAIIFKKDKFELCSSNEYTLTSEVLQNSFLEDIKQKIQDNEKLIKQLSELNTQLHIAVLKFRAKEDNLIVVGNTHLYFHPDADNIRLLQGIIAFRILHQTANKLKTENPTKKVSIVFCGDFNSTPDCGVYKFITEGHVGSDCIDWFSNPEQVVKDLSCSHDLKIQSAYGRPRYTNYTQHFKDCLDYIFYQTDHIELKQIVPLPSEEELSLKVAIPSEYFPSDHLALVADLKLTS